MGRSEWSGVGNSQRGGLVSFGQSASKFYRIESGNLGPAPSIDSVTVDKSQTSLELVSSSAKWESYYFL